MLCPNCHKQPATQHPQIGILPCLPCSQKQESLLKPGLFRVEFTTEDIKEQRGQFSDDIEQTHYKGALNKKWVDIYGEEAARKRGFTQEEIDNADYVMDGVIENRYYPDKAL